MDGGTMILPHTLGQRRDRDRIGQIAGVRRGRSSRGGEGSRAGLDLFRRAVDEDQRCTEPPERRGNDFANLAFGADAREHDDRSGERGHTASRRR
jgi:hypothetical protein